MPLLLALEAGVFSSATTLASQGGGGNALFVDVALVQGTADGMSVGDIRPVARGEWGGRIGLDYSVRDWWAASLAGQVGGSWFDFNGFAVSGKVVDSDWRLRGGVDRLMPIGRGAMLFAGLGVEYGERRSWLDNLTISQQGPHNYLVGGSVRIGAAGPRSGRVQVFGELLESFYRGHARDGTSGYKYNWLGRSLTCSVGVRCAVMRGRNPQ